MTTEIEVKNAVEIQSVEDYAMSPEKLLSQVAIIENIAKAVMKDGQHYGKIPGCGDKPTLLKPGAEKLLIAFRLAPEYDIESSNEIGGHREYEITCKLTSIVTGAFISQGVGCCSTMESKYRYRSGERETTEFPVPKEYWDCWKKDPEKAMGILRAVSSMTGNLGIAKGDDKKWYVAVQGEKKEHDNPADYYNTVKKMAKKRALVDAVLSATGASDVFTQDIEDLKGNGVMGNDKKTENKAPKKEPETQKDHPDLEESDEFVPITANQVGKLRNLLKKKDLDDAYITEQFDISKLENLPKSKNAAALELIMTYSAS